VSGSVTHGYVILVLNHNPRGVLQVHRMSPTLMMAVAALLLAFACVTPVVDSHAVMIDPPSRQWNDYLWNYNYNPHAVNAGGQQLQGWRQGRVVRLQPHA
jgi:hypothetical protein